MKSAEELFNKWAAMGEIKPSEFTLKKKDFYSALSDYKASLRKEIEKTINELRKTSNISVSIIDNSKRDYAIYELNSILNLIGE